MPQPLNYQLSFGGEKIPEPAPVKKETLISGSTPDQIKLVSGIAQNWVTDYLKSENPDADVSSLGEVKYNPNLPVFDNAFPAINDQTDFKALGLEDENGKVTTKGEQYAELKDLGIITQFGGLSNHGKALLMSEDDALLPENIDIFRAREDIGMYKGEDVGVLKQIGDLSTELATGVQNIVTGAAQYGLGGLAQIGVLSDENKAADIAGGVAAIDAFTTGMAKLPMMSEGIVDSLVTLVATQMADSEDIAMVQAQHRQDVLRKASLQADYSFLEQVAPIIDYVPQKLSLPPVIGGSIETASKTMGEANYSEFTQPIQAVSQFSPMLLQGPLAPLGLAIQPEMLAIHATQTGATKLWAAAAAPVARAAFRAGETAKIVRQLEVDASILNAQQSIAITKAEKASNLSVSLSEKANTATFTGDVVGSKAAADVAARADALAKSSKAYAENIGGRLNNVNEQIAKFQNAYGVADRTLKIADTFRKWPTVAGAVVGWPLEQLGKGLIATRKGVDAVSARTDKIGGMIRLADKVSGIGVGAVGSVFNPMLAVPAVAKVAGKGILALGPVIKGVGSFTRVMGEAASERAASIPFWQKVANFENLNPTQRMLANGFSEFAVAGGYLKRVGGNYAKTYPAFLGLEYLHSGDLKTAAKNAIAPTIVIGAPGALLGSAVTGSRSDLRKLAQQDMLNFRSRMPSEQRQKFDSMDSGVKKVVANVAESQPGVKFDFTDTGRGRFDENTYTVFINPNSRSPLRPIVTHEFLHHITEAGGATNSINHLLFGNEIGTGGLLKSVDGRYDKDYLKFKDEYIKLQEQDDAARRRNGQEVKAQTMDDAYMGMEYFVETQVDRLLRMSESGELSRLAGKTQLQRFASKKINELADSMMNRGAFLENLAMRMGSLRDNKGEYVMGNGILAEGVRDMPEMRNLFNKLISETSGRRPNATKSMDARSTSKSSQGREIPITDNNDPMIGSMYSDFVFDENNVVKRDQYGNPERISNDRKKSQESIGLSVADLQAKRIQSGESLLPGELRYDPQAKEWVGNYLTPEQIDVIRNSGFFEQPFLDSLDLVNGAAKRGLGEVVNLSYSAATKRNKKMGPSYFSGGVTLRQISPIEVRINKAGGIYVKSVDVLQLRANINEMARSKEGSRVYDGDAVAIADDVNAVMKLHANDQPTDAYFAKYGAEAQTRKKLINSVFGKTLIDKGINEFSSSAPRSVIKDFRIDRFGKSVLKKGTDGVQVNHKFVRINYLPEGPLRSNDAGDVVVGNPELKAKIEERNRKLGLPPSDGFADTTKPVEATGGKETPAKNATVEDFNKPNEFYRVIRGSKAFDDIVKSGLVRTDSEFKPTGLSKGAIANRPTAFPSFSKGEVSKNYIAGENNHYVIATSDSSIAPSTLGRHGKGSTMFPTDANGKAMKSLDASNVDVYKHIGDGKYDLVYSNGQEVKEGGNMRPSNLAPLPETNKIPDFYNYDRIESDSGGGEADTFQSGSVFYKDYRNKQKGFGMWKDEGGAKSRPASLEEFRIRTNLHNLFFPDSKIDIIYADKDGVITSQKEVYGDQVETDDVRGLLKQKGWDHVSGDTFRHKSGAMMYDADYNGATTYEKDADGNMEAVNWIPFDVLIVPGKTRESDPSTLNRLPEPATTSYLPEGKHDRDTAIKNKDVFAKRFENFKPQVGVDGVDVGWQRPSDGKFVDTGEHYNFYKDDNGNQLGNPNEIGYVRIVKEGKDLYYEGKPNPKQLRELKDTSIELGLTLIADNESTRYLPEGDKKTKKRQVIGDDMVIDKGDSDTLDVIQSVNAETQMPSWKDDKPVPVSFGYDLASAPHINKFAGKVENPSTEFLDNLPYDLNRAEYGRVKSLIENGVVDYFANKMANETRVVLKDPAIAAGKGWYSRMRVKLLNALGETGRELFSQFLGATSAQTPVDENFLQTVDAHEGMKSGRYDRHRKGYLTAIKAEMNGTLDKEIVKTKSVESIQTILSKLKDALPLAKVKADKIAIYAEIKSLTKLIETPVNERTEAQRIKLYVVANDLLPRRSNGAKFNANSGAVLKVIAGVWLNNRESPKTPNFAGNLSGRTVQATIDIWAARYIRRMIYGGEGVPWRIQPKSEVGVSKEDFAFSQIVMERAAKKLDMNPDDLQAILWFAEKDFWDKKKWTKNEGAKKSSFDDIFDIFFPEGKKPLSFAEGSAMIKNAREQQKAIAKKEKKDNLKAEANALGISVAALTRMKKQKN